MFETVKKFSEITLTFKKSKMNDFLLITLLLINGVHSIRTGELAQHGQFNYVVSVQKLNKHLCTGTIIDETHVLTIAHRLLGEQRVDLSVAAGSARLLSGSVSPIQIKKVYFHPRLQNLYIPGSAGDDWENDIAILELAMRFQWSINYGPVQRTIIEFDQLICPICTMITWVDARSQLMQMWNIVFPLNPEQCIDEFIYVGENQQCFIDEFIHLSINSEDLGSPIICNDKMVGFVDKKALDDELITPLTFLETLAYSEFINDVLTKGLVDVHPDEFPYIVSIWDDEFYLCGGSILDATHILTTANCVWEKDISQLKVVAGPTEVSAAHAELSELSIHHIKTHDKYKSWYTKNWEDWYTEYDIAILVLAKPVPSELTLQPLDYLNTQEISPGLFCNSLHWKDEQDSSGAKFKKLRKASVKISTTENCKRVLASQGMPITASQFCAKNQYLIRVADSEDYGNPLICEGKLVGILVKAFPSSDEKTAESVYLEINPYKEFIHSAMAGEKTIVTTPSS